MDLKLSWNDYQEMWNRVTAFKKVNGRLPNYVDIQNYRVTKEAYLDAAARVKEFVATNHRNPYNVTVEATPLTPPRVVGPIQTACEKLLGQFNTLTEFTNKCRGRGYGNYYNDIKTLEQEYTSIANLNCTDSTQLLVHLGKEMGYEMHYVHVKCLKSGGGHVIAKVKGKEFTAYTYIDLAAMMSKTTQATIGRGWCFDAIPVNGRVDPSWLTRPDDGIT